MIRLDRNVRSGRLRTGINRILNRLVLLDKHPGPPKRMSRIPTDRGRAAFRTKLRDP